MERSGIDKLKKACIILPLVVAVIFNSSVAAIDRENNSKLSCGIDSYYVKDMIAQDDHIWLLLHDSSIDKDAVACINEKTLELQACYRSGEDLEDEMIIQNMSVQPNGSVWLDLRFLYKGIIIKHNKTEPTYTKTSLFLCEKRRFLWPGLRKEGNLFKLAGPGGLAFFHLTKKEVSKWPMKK